MLKDVGVGAQLSCYGSVFGLHSRRCELGTWKLACSRHDPDLRQEEGDQDQATH